MFEVMGMECVKITGGVLKGGESIKAMALIDGQLDDLVALP